MLKSNPTNFEFMIGLHLGSFTCVLSELGGGHWG